VTHYLSVEGLFKLEVTHGEPFWEAIKAKQDYLTLLEKEEAVAIHVGEDILPLQAPVLSDGALRLVRRGTVLGQRIAERSSMFVVGMAAYRLFGKSTWRLSTPMVQESFAAWMSP